MLRFQVHHTGAVKKMSVACRCQATLPNASLALLPQVLLDDNRHITLTDTPPEEERIEEPEAGTPTQASKRLNVQHSACASTYELRSHS